MRKTRILLGAAMAVALYAPAKADVIFDTRTGMGLEPNGIAFVNALYEGYADLAQNRYWATDLLDAEHFNHKARRAGRRSDVLPDEITSRKLSEEAAEGFSAALKRLRDGFDRGGRSLAPADAARAQVSYDCWIEAAEGANPAHGASEWAKYRLDDVERCRTAFEEAMSAVEDVAKLKLTPFSRPARRPAMAAAQAAAPMPAPAPAPAMEAPKPFVIFFAFDSAKVTAAGTQVVEDAIGAAERMGIVDYSITGHADRAGSEDHNLALSLRRANAVRDLLVARGVKASGISVAGRGEADPAVQTADNVREPANRRVEIILL